MVYHIVLSQPRKYKKVCVCMVETSFVDRRSGGCQFFVLFNMNPELFRHLPLHYNHEHKSDKIKNKNNKMFLFLFLFLRLRHLLARLFQFVSSLWCLLYIGIYFYVKSVLIFNFTHPLVVLSFTVRLLSIWRTFNLRLFEGVEQTLANGNIAIFLRAFR